ncbi:M20 metallopeptidase family protein [Ectobacillus polymachus]|uniref:M20 metallopeptidase family protein n=1 Tax=Ectobacillus polymachus TaxID=1508806 RepID=UPI003A845D55
MNDFQGNNIKEKTVSWRRHLHMYPEVSFREHNTSQFVYETLQSFPRLEIVRPTVSSVMAILKGKKEGKTIALRADMDALPLQEENDVSYASKIPGVMHACGHDAHTAILLGAADVLSQQADSLAGEVRFLFQHAEEQYPGGAEELVQKGVMDEVDAVVGLHMMSGLSTGKIGITYGPMMAAPDVFDIIIEGSGGHAAHPKVCIDPIAIGAQIVTNLQHIISRGNDAFDQRVLSVTQFHAGTADNIIPERAHIMGTVRSFKEELRKDADTRIRQITKGIVDAHGATFSYSYRYGYRPVINDPEITGLIEQCASELLGNEKVIMLQPSMGGEDFSAYLQKAKGCFFKLGSGSTPETSYPHHHPRFDIDEESLSIGVRMFVHIVHRFLSAD